MILSHLTRFVNVRKSCRGDTFLDQPALCAVELPILHALKIQTAGEGQTFLEALRCFEHLIGKGDDVSDRQRTRQTQESPVPRPLP